MKVNNLDLNKEKDKFNWTGISLFSFSIVWIIEGIIFIIEDKAIIGLHRNLSLNVVGGWLIVLSGIIFLYVSYHSLSPFGKIRSFLEGPGRKRKSGNRNPHKKS